MTAALYACLAVFSVSATHDPAPQWIWGSASREVRQEFYLRQKATVAGKLVRARLTMAADFCHAAIFVNDTEAARREPYSEPARLDVTTQLRQGENTLSIYARSVEGPAAVMLRLELEYADGARQMLVSDEQWQATPLGAPSDPNKVQVDWASVAAFGSVDKHLWDEAGQNIAIKPADNYEQWRQALGVPAGADPQTFQSLPGFEVRLIRSAADKEDSWVSLACDDRGRWIIAKEKQGLLRLTLPASNGGPVRVEPIDNGLAECRGLLFAHGALYAMANNDRALFRLRDTDGDDRYDEVTRLATFEGGLGHGRNQITLGPDGLIYGIFGDSVAEPPAARALPPTLANPTRQEKATSGFVARTDRDGRRWEVVTRGLRNPFGIDFHPDGEMFTYDADAEYDMGASWYRPTRINHLLIGGDFGWRNVTRDWPPYFPDRPDMPQPTLDIGKGSPTSVKFGTSSRFPPPYHDALFALDWSYGRILAVHLAPRGSSYTAHAETFLRGRPLNVTDLEFGPDGAMYFITGGRGTRSALYRVAYTGEPRSAASPTEQQLAVWRHAEESRRIRRRLESLLGRTETAAIDEAWPHLGSSDPWIRHAARAVVEWRPVASWRDRALAETSPSASLAALLALSRVGAWEDRAAIVARLNELDLARLTERHKLEAAFLYERCLPEEASPTNAQMVAARQRLDPLYPDASPRVNIRLSRLLARLAPEGFIPRTLQLLDQAENQNGRLHYLFVLRDTRDGWTPALREAYFAELSRMTEFAGGEGMPTFRRLIETDAVAALPDEERATYSKLLLGSLLDTLEVPSVEEKRPFVRQWKLEDFEGLLGDARSRDLEQGKRMFTAARCMACHRFDGAGGVSGPDLTSLAGRFAPRDMLLSILEPSRVVAENYRHDAFTLHDGRVIVGRILPGDYRAQELRLQPDLLTPEKTVTIAKSEIESHQLSPTSPMPTGLLDTLSQDEILDLLAYLSSK